MTSPPPLRWIDAHLDLAYVALAGHDLRRDVPAAERRLRCVSLPALRAASIDTVFATIFTEPGGSGPCAYPDSADEQAAAAAGRRQLDLYEHWHQTADARIRDSHHVPSSHRETPAPPAASPPTELVILMEGADPIRSPDEVEAWRRRGLRVVGLTWAAGTRYAGGNASGGPLTRAGIDLIHALDAAGVAHDASHLSDEALDGVLAHAKGPIVATHSNCRALCPCGERNLRDDHIAAIGARGGIVGLNLYTRFIAQDRRATVHDAVAHVEHICAVMEHRRGVGLGSDMDGGFGPDELPEGADGPARLVALADALGARGWSDEDVRGFAAGNWRRWLDETAPSTTSTPAPDFISEPIEPERGSFHPELITQGLAGLPAAFTWRGRRYAIVECLDHRKQSTAEPGSGEMYLRRQQFRVRLDSGETAEIYVERQGRGAPGTRAAKTRWFLYTIASGE